MLTVVHHTDEAIAHDGGAHRSLLDEIVRDGARQMLAAALRAEVSAYVEQFADQRDENGHRLVTVPNTPRRSPRSSRTPTCSWSSTSTPPSTGSI